MPEPFECPICYFTIKSAVECAACYQAFCAHCAAAVGSCPLCRATPFTHPPSLALRRIIASTPTACPDGCDVRLTIGDLEAHAALCPEVAGGCPHVGCAMVLVRRDLPDHIAECPWAPVACPHDCSIPGLTRQSLAAHLASVCLNVRVACIYGCGEEVPRHQSQAHRKGCPMLRWLVRAAAASL
jgi:hypothetical protein